MFLCSVVASATLVVGCYATVSPAADEGDDVVYAAPPPQIETYPVVVYGGEPHYSVEGRWYRHTARGWGYYRREPAHLAHRRPPLRHEERHEERR
jgi:hypothetical protein